MTSNNETLLVKADLEKVDWDHNNRSEAGEPIRRDLTRVGLNMKFKTKIGKIETDQTFYNYSDDPKALNSRWFQKDTFLGIGEDGQKYHLHYVDSKEIWVAVRI